MGLTRNVMVCNCNCFTHLNSSGFFPEIQQSNGFKQEKFMWYPSS